MKPWIVLNSQCSPLPALFRNSNPYRFGWTVLSWKWAVMFVTLWPPSPSAGQRVQGRVDKGVNSYWSLEEKHVNLRMGTPCSLSSWPPTREELIILFIWFLEIFIKANLLKNSEASWTYIFCVKNKIKGMESWTSLKWHTKPSMTWLTLFPTCPDLPFIILPLNVSTTLNVFSFSNILSLQCLGCTWLSLDSVFFSPTFLWPWPCWILHNVQLRGCFCALAFPDPPPFWSAALRHCVIDTHLLVFVPYETMSSKKACFMRACVFFMVFTTMLGTSFNRLANLPQAAFYVPPFVLIAQLNMTEQMTDGYL